MQNRLRSLVEFDHGCCATFTSKASTPPGACPVAGTPGLGGNPAQAGPPMGASVPAMGPDTGQGGGWAWPVPGAPGPVGQVGAQPKMAAVAGAGQAVPAGAPPQPQTAPHSA